jgi:hypothetical protein
MTDEDKRTEDDKCQKCSFGEEIIGSKVRTPKKLLWVRILAIYSNSYRMTSLISVSVDYKFYVLFGGHTYLWWLKFLNMFVEKIL